LEIGYSLNKLTIVIPTHERHHVLERVIDYYSSWDCTIIICDSSEVQYNNTLPENIIYLHFPGKSIGHKLYNAMLQVNSLYTCLSPDDDFLAKYALLQGMQFLDDNQDYASVSGNIINFKSIKKKAHIRPVVSLPESKHGYHIDSDVIFDRVMGAIGRQHEYALHRTFVAKKCMKVVRGVKAITPFHVTFSLLAMCYGKHITLPLFWQARDLDRYSYYATLDNEDFYIKEQKNPVELESQNNKANLNMVMNWSKYLSSLDGKNYRDCFIHESQDLIKNKFERERIFDMAFYNLDSNSEKEKIKVKYKIKKITPNVIWGLYTAFRDSERMSLKMIKEYKNKEGYPWSDHNSKRDWQCMLEVINKHKNLIKHKI
jgi:glycosyltransferase domain-containing protein